MRELPEGLQTTLTHLPESPGVYLMKAEDGRVLYVGKAKSLKHRARSYFQDARLLPHRTRLLVVRVRDVSYIVTASEAEALVLEATLIKEHAPRYNVLLKDDKRYPYVTVTVQEAFPRVLVTRRIEQDGARYFGPYTQVHKMRTSLQLAQRLFPIRSCHYDLVKNQPPRECLDYFIGRCLAPCTGRQSQEDYRRTIDEVLLFLSGRTRAAMERVEAHMQEASAALQFERAGQLRDELQALSALQDRQRVVSVEETDQDVVGLARDGGDACGVLLTVRDGRLRGLEHHYLRNALEVDDGALLSLFLTQYYLRDRDFPDEVLLPFDFPDRPLVEEWLRAHCPRPPRWVIPQRGRRRQLLDLAATNSHHLLEEFRIQKAAARSRAPESLGEIQRAFALPALPRRMVCFDISTIQGADSVGSAVVFENGRPRKDGYRRFHIKTVAGQDDFAMIEEVVGRYFRRALDEKWPLPDLVVIDGGKGQLHSAGKRLAALGLSLPLAAIAKDKVVGSAGAAQDVLYVPGERDPRVLPRRSPALRLLMALRDEAHRFAVEFHRATRARHLRDSRLDAIPGIGPARRHQLLLSYGSVERIAQSTPDELAQVPGLSRRLGERILQHLGGPGEIPASQGEPSARPAHPSPDTGG